MPRTLFDAAKDGNIEEAEELIKQGADVNKTDETGECDGPTALHYAAERGDIKFGRLLYQHGANASESVGFRGGMKAFHYAAEKGNLDFARWLVRVYKINIDEDTHFGETALHFAAINEHFEFAEWLIKRGAEVDMMISAELGEDATPLILVARKGNVKFGRLLLCNGADVNIKNLSDQKTALVYAAEEKNFEFAKLLISNGARYDEISWMDDNEAIKQELYILGEIYKQIMHKLEENMSCIKYANKLLKITNNKDVRNMFLTSKTMLMKDLGYQAKELVKTEQESVEVGKSFLELLPVEIQNNIACFLSGVDRKKIVGIHTDRLIRSPSEIHKRKDKEDIVDIFKSYGIEENSAVTLKEYMNPNVINTLKIINVLETEQQKNIKRPRI